tara:strand:+ start:63 stop:560 length:498 start_codon:yes stop_codon:yes gene_type:complete
MISFNTILNRLDTVFYLIIFAIIYVAIIYLWRKIAQLESSFYKLETTFATQLLYKNKETSANKVAEDIFLQVFDNKSSSTLNPEPMEPKVQEIPEDTIPEEIKEEPIITEMSDALTTSTQDDTILSKSKLAKMSVEQLKEHCGSLGISVEGNKTELINRILLQQK